MTLEDLILLSGLLSDYGKVIERDGNPLAAKVIAVITQCVNEDISTCTNGKQQSRN